MALPIKTGHIMIGLAIIMAVISAIVVKNIAGSGNQTADVKIPEVAKTLDIVIAAKGLPAGSVIDPGDIKTGPWPKKYLNTSSVFTDTELKDVVGKVLAHDIFPGEPILREKLALYQSRGGLPVIIPEGMRAITISVSEIKGVAGFIKTGDRVDVVSTYKKMMPTANGTKSTSVSSTLIQNALVLAVAQEMDTSGVSVAAVPKGVASLDDEEDEEAGLTEKEKKALAKEKEKNMTKEEKREARKAKLRKARGDGDSDTSDPTRGKLVSSITLAVTPEEAQELTFAEEEGELRLVLRPEGDATISGLGEVNANSLGALGGGATMFTNMFDNQPEVNIDVKLPPAPALRPVTTVEFYDGTEKRDVSF